jgi:Flp pilus assembly protein TadG
MRIRRGLAKSEQGATAVEFALVLPLFLAFVLAIIDVSVYYFVSGQLQHGVVQGARAIRTGNIIGNNATTRDAFRAAVCSNIESFLIASCTSNIRVDVRSFATFAAINAGLPANAAAYDINLDGTISDGETTFDTGNPSCPVVVRAFYKYSTIVPGLQNVLAGIVPGTLYLTAATAFRNEPFGTGTGTGVPCS